MEQNREQKLGLIPTFCFLRACAVIKISPTEINLINLNVFNVKVGKEV